MIIFLGDIADFGLDQEKWKKILQFLMHYIYLGKLDIDIVDKLVA